MTENGITLREFFERLLNDHTAAHAQHQAAHDREHAAAQKAIDRSEELARSNKADSNEWRQAMTDRERTFARVDAMEVLGKRIEALERANAQAQGVLAMARFVGFGGLLSGLGALIWIVTQGL